MYTIFPPAPNKPITQFLHIPTIPVTDSLFWLAVLATSLSLCIGGRERGKRFLSMLNKI